MRFRVSQWFEKDVEIQGTRYLELEATSLEEAQQLMEQMMEADDPPEWEIDQDETEVYDYGEGDLEFEEIPNQERRPD